MKPIPLTALAGAPQRPGVAGAAATPPRVPPTVGAAPLIPQVAPAGSKPPGIPPSSGLSRPVVPPVAASKPLAPGIAPVVPPVAPPATFTPGSFPPVAPGTPDTTIDGDALLSLDSRYESLKQSDYFQLLQIEQSAAPGDIKKAFYRESRALHPDKFYHLPAGELKERVNELYKRITEAYYVLRDDAKRKQYLADVTGPDRLKKLRFTEATEADAKAAAKKEQEEQIGTHPKARGFYTTAMQDFDGERWEAAKRNLKMALTYEPSNARYKEKLAEVEKRLDASRDKSDPYKIK